MSCLGASREWRQQTRRQDVQTEFHATVIGIFGEIIGGRDESSFHFCDAVGRFRLVVVDRENGLESEDIPIRIVAPERGAARGAELFSSGGMGTLLALQGSEYGERVAPLFHRLSKEHSDTVYGRYATISLALSQADKLLTQRDAKRIRTRSEVCANLKQGVALFAEGHPLRSQALLALARLESTPEQEGNPTETLTQLLGESSDGRIRQYVKEYSAQLDRIRRGRAGSDRETTRP